MQVTYLAHDLDDPSCWRRVEMLRRGGASVTVAGFRRGEGPLPESATVLGRTGNGRFLQRLAAIAAAAPRIARVVPAPEHHGPETILARNLEMLALGARLRRRRGAARLVYELLDVHGLMLGAGAVSRVLRTAEAVLLRRSALVVVSSQAFVTNYLTAYGQPQRPTLLVENKPFATAPVPTPTPTPRPGPKVVGWFGMLRCRWSLETLDAVTRARPGAFRVVLRGRPALDVLPDLAQVVAANPDLSFEGPYRWPDDLAAIYGDIDAAWLIDRYQAGQNSDWLLPNRLYEGCSHGAAPIVLAGTEVARRAAGWGCGLTVARPDAAAVADVLAELEGPALPQARAAVAAIPPTALQMDDDECRALTRTICGAGGDAARGGV